MGTVVITFEIIHDGEHKYLERVLELEIKKVCEIYNVEVFKAGTVHMG